MNSFEHQQYVLQGLRRREALPTVATANQQSLIPGFMHQFADYVKCFLDPHKNHNGRLDMHREMTATQPLISPVDEVAAVSRTDIRLFYQNTLLALARQRAMSAYAIDVPGKKGSYMRRSFAKPTTLSPNAEANKRLLQPLVIDDLVGANMISETRSRESSTLDAKQNMLAHNEYVQEQSFITGLLAESIKAIPGFVSEISKDGVKGEIYVPSSPYERLAGIGLMNELPSPVIRYG